MMALYVNVNNVIHEHRHRKIKTNIFFEYWVHHVGILQIFQLAITSALNESDDSSHLHLPRKNLIFFFNIGPLKVE